MFQKMLQGGGGSKLNPQTIFISKYDANDNNKTYNVIQGKHYAFLWMNSGGLKATISNANLLFEEYGKGVGISTAKIFANIIIFEATSNTITTTSVSAIYNAILIQLD